MAVRRRPEREVRRAQWEIAGVGMLAIGMGLALVVLLPDPLAPSVLPLEPTRPLQAAATLCFTVGLLGIGGAVAHRRWYFSSAQRFRRELGDPEGWLDREDYDSAAGEEALRRGGEREEPHTRPGPGEAPPPVTRYGFSPGTLVSGRRGPGGVRGREVYSPWSRGVCVLGPQGSGKTQLLIHLALDSPAALLFNSTKPEGVLYTQPLRARLGPTTVFNPLGVGGLENTAFWDPVSGCAAENTATLRAWGLVRGAGGAEGINRASFWAGKAAEVLRCYLMAAALGNLDMTAVAHWANNPDDDHTALSILDQHPDTPAGWNSQLRAILGTVKETRDGYFATVASAVAFMDSPTVRAACRPPAGRGLDVEEFLRARGTLYMIGSDDDARLAPLFTALTEHIFAEAKRVAGTYGGRLPQPLNLLLDEVAHMTPVPLHKWAGDSRGWGITVVPVVQALSQFGATWGRDNADTIWRNLPTRLALPGINDRETLEELSYLAGTRPVREITEGINHQGGGGGGSSTSTRLTTEPVITGPAIGAMPRWHVYALGLCRHPAMLRYEPGYQRVAREMAVVGNRGDHHPGDDPDDGRRATTPDEPRR